MRDNTIIIKVGWGLVCAILLWAASGAGMVQAQEKGVATILSVENRPRLKSIGAWETAIQDGLPLFSGDKIFTGNGSIQILFHDNSILTIWPHSIVRLIESEGVRRKHIKRRDLRLLIGKIKYESGEQSRAQVRVLWPSGVYPLSEGVSVISRHNNSGTVYETVVFATKASAGVNGAIKQAAKEADPPDISPETVKADPHYQKTRIAIEAMRLYSEKKQNLEKAKMDRHDKTYLSMSRSDRPILYDHIEDQHLDRRSIRFAYQEHGELSGKLADYAAANLEELLSENELFSKNPDSQVAADSQETSYKAQATQQRRQELAQIINLAQAELKNLKSQSDNAQHAQAKLALSYQMVATLETCSGIEKSMLAQTLVIEGVTIGTPAITEAFDFLEPYAATVNTLDGRLFLEDLKPLVKAVLESQETVSNITGFLPVMDDNGVAKFDHLIPKQKIKPTEQTIVKLIKLIQIIGNTISRYSGLNNLLVNAYEANLLPEKSGFAEEELLTAIKEWVNIYDTCHSLAARFRTLDMEKLKKTMDQLAGQAEKVKTAVEPARSYAHLLAALDELALALEAYNNAVVQLKGLEIEELNHALKSLVEKYHKIESSEQMFNNFITEYLRLSAVLSAVSGSGWRELLPALTAHTEIETGLNCLKCEEFTRIRKQQLNCLDVPQCFKCNPMGQLVPDDGAFCDDGDPCTKNDRCIGGVCRGVRVLSAEDPNCR